MPKSIGIPAFFPPHQQSGGVFSVFDNLIRGFDQLLAEPRFRDLNFTVFHGGAVRPRPGANLHWQQVPQRFGRFISEARVAAVEGGRSDALLFLNYHTPLVVRADRVVTIIHDLQYRHMPEFFSLPKRLRLRACHAVTLHKCHRVVTISGAVKDDMLRAYGSRWQDRIEVIWNPVSLERFDGATDQDFTGGRPYILCVAVDRPQKNLFRLIRAFAQVRARHPEYCLVLAGQLRSHRRDAREKSAEISRTMPSAVDLVEDLGLADHVRVTGFVDDQTLGSLYRGATLCVLPSLFEGFGMPAVESLAMGKPTLVSGLPVLREITLGLAQYLDDPTDVGAMGEAIAEMLDHPEQYRPPDDRIDDVRHAFSPRTIAQRYIEVLTD